MDTSQQPAANAAAQPGGGQAARVPGGAPAELASHTTLAVLMYHAVRGDHEPCPGGAEANYTVSRSGFETHLRLLAATGRRASSVARFCSGEAGPAPTALFTFDDGHTSNGPAAELLAQHGGTADFFVNPSTVGSANFLSWAALRDMAAAGMSIQSHGFHHHYLDQLAPAEVMSELVDSKHEIEARLGSEVTLFAPPGGRQPAGFGELAQRAGYRRVCSSRADYWQTAQGSVEIPRLAVLSSTPDEQLRRWVTLDGAEQARQRRRHRTLGWAKRLLGNQSYDAVRGVLLGLAGRRG